jgi:hypothetical protein
MFINIYRMNTTKPLLAMTGRGYLGRYAPRYSMSMHEVVVKVVAMAVSTVMRMLSILLQSDFCSIGF